MDEHAATVQESQDKYNSVKAGLETQIRELEDTIKILYIVREGTRAVRRNKKYIDPKTFFRNKDIETLPRYFKDLRNKLNANIDQQTTKADRMLYVLSILNSTAKS